eukprot:4732352-Pyramimonas_sp.AAC.1
MAKDAFASAMRELLHAAQRVALSGGSAAPSASTARLRHDFGLCVVRHALDCASARCSCS